MPICCVMHDDLQHDLPTRSGHAMPSSHWWRIPRLLWRQTWYCPFSGVNPVAAMEVTSLSRNKGCNFHCQVRLPLANLSWLNYVYIYIVLLCIINMGIYEVIWGVPLIAAIVWYCFLGDPAVVLQPLVALFLKASAFWPWWNRGLSM